MKSYEAPPADWDCTITTSRIPKDGEPLVVSFELPLDGVIRHWGQTYEPRGPVRALAEASLTGNRILLRLSVQGNFSLPCYRCLCETGLAISGDLRYLFTLRPVQEERMADVPGEDGDVDVIPLDSFQTEIDLAPYVWEVLLLYLPERILCTPDCKGLCPLCGQNRNENDCGCKEDDTDPRFAVLRNLN